MDGIGGSILKKYTVTEATRILEVSRQTIMKWLSDKKKFPHAEKGTRSTDPWHIPASDLEMIRRERIADLEREIGVLETIKERVETAVIEYKD